MTDMSDVLDEVAAENGTVADELPDNFTREDGKIVGFKEAKGKLVPEVVCGDFTVKARTRDGSGGKWGREIEFRDPDGNVKIIEIADELLQGEPAKLRGHVASAGLWLSPTRWAKEKFAELMANYDTARRVTTYAKPGLYGAVFVTPSGEAIHAEKVENHTARLTKRQAGPFVAGTLEGCQAAARDVLRNEHLPHVGLGVFTGVAGTLIAAAGLPSRALHLAGPSSRGKSTAQIAGASAWATADKDKGLLVTTKGTTNAIEYVYERGNDCSIHFDEGANADPKTIHQMGFNFAEGGGRKRITSDIRERETPNWRGFLTLSSEKSLSAIAAEVGQNRLGGAAVRMASITVADLAPIDPAEADRLKHAFETNYGHMGPAFVRGMFAAGFHQEDGTAKLRAMVAGRVCDLAGANAPPTVARAGVTFAVLWVVGDLMLTFGLLPDVTAADVERVARWGWGSFLSEDDSAPLDVAGNAADELLNKLRTSPGIVDLDGDGRHFGEVLAWFNGEHVFIPAKQLAKFKLSAGDRSVLAELDRRGLLIKEGKNRVSSRVPGKGKVPHYRLALQLRTNAAEDKAADGEAGGDVATAAFRYPDPPQRVH